MPLWSDDFALDTETDVPIGEEERRTMMVQACPVSARGVEDVRVWYGKDAWKQFMKTFEETSGKKLRCHCYNLGNFEQVSLIRDALDGYEFTESRVPGKGQWCMVADDKTVYKISVKNRNGCVLEFTDDMRRVGGASMKKIAEGVRVEHPDWWGDMERVKDDTTYEDGWLQGEGREKALRYAKLDAFSQAMIARYLILNGCDKKLTAPSNGLSESLALKYRGKDAIQCEGQEMLYAKKDFQRWYPPLDREMQDIAEASLLGGFVWGWTGEHHGTFCHIDYSSSYPYEYAYGKLFYGRILRFKPGTEMFKKTMNDDALFRWVLVSFSFDYKEGMMPCISGKECVNKGHYGGPEWNQKMRHGEVSRKLYTWTYFEEMKKHYDVHDVTIHEIWAAKRRTGDFEPVIRHFYEKKNRLKAEGLDGSAEYNLTKLYMNGGIHGKTITKTHRQKRLWNSVEGHFEYIEEVNDPELCFMIGFTAMMNARERLLKHCRRVIDAGYHVMMCDTDSMVVDAPAAVVRELFKDWMTEGTAMETCLGRFDMENDRKGLKRCGVDAPVSEEFDEFRCWGLKRYCEVRTIEGYGRLCRKTAFAGMHDDVQEEILMHTVVDTEYTFEWTQKGKRTGKYCAEIVDTVKHASASDVWYEEEPAVKKGVFKEESMKEFVKMYRKKRIEMGLECAVHGTG